MKHFTTFSLLLLASVNAFCQMGNHTIGDSNASKLYFYWGWNGSSYSKSNIQFTGKGYDFTLKKVIAKDRQLDFSLNTYLNPLKATIPQYNFRLGYYIKDNWDISFGIDHMKYVVKQNQTVDIKGFIKNNNPSYDGAYSSQNIQITEDFLKFEHTDGLNYVNFELRHSDSLVNLKKININLIEGLGIGVLYPRTNVSLLGKETYDQFHISGYGFAALIGLRVSFFNRFFIQSEMKGGFINLPDVRTTNSTTDRASHHFFFSQHNIVFGGIINIKTKANKK